MRTIRNNHEMSASVDVTDARDAPTEMRVISLLIVRRAGAAPSP